MTTDEIPQPYHRWAANEDMDVRPFSMKDRCLVCGVVRSSFLSGGSAVRSDAVAAGPCPLKNWREMNEIEVARQVISYIDGEPQTRAQREVLADAEETMRS